MMRGCCQIYGVCLLLIFLSCDTCPNPSTPAHILDIQVHLYIQLLILNFHCRSPSHHSVAYLLGAQPTTDKAAAHHRTSPRMVYALLLPVGASLLSSLSFHHSITASTALHLFFVLLGRLRREGPNNQPECWYYLPSFHPLLGTLCIPAIRASPGGQQAPEATRTSSGKIQGTQSLYHCYIVLLADPCGPS